MGDALVDQCLGYLRLDVWRVAVTDTLDHCVVGCQLLFGLAALAVGDTLVDQRLGDLKLKVACIADLEASPPPVVHSQRRHVIVAVEFRHEVEQVVDERGIVAFAS